MTSISIKPGRFAALSFGLLAAWACSVVDKGDYTFTDNPSEGGDGQGASSGESNATGGTGGKAGTGSGAKGGVGGKGGAAGKGGTGGSAGVGGKGGSAGKGGKGGVGGKGGTGGSAGESGAGQGGVPPTGDCGNGDVDSGEDCDNGTKNGATSCTYGQMSCTVCTDDCKRASGKATYCGDSKTQSSHEECDDGNMATETCDYGDTSCPACTPDCKKVAVRECGDRVVNGDEITSIDIEYTGLWGYSCDTKQMPFYLNGVPIQGALPGPCSCTPTIPTLHITDPAVLAAVRPSGNVLELRSGVTYYDYTYFGWLKMTFNVGAGATAASTTTFNPNGYALDNDLCSTHVVYRDPYTSAPFDVGYVEQCDGSNKCLDCAAPLTVDGFTGALGPVFAGWTQCAGYLDTAAGSDEVPIHWGAGCKVGGYDQLLLACGDNLRHFRYIEVDQNLLRDGMPGGVTQADGVVSFRSDQNSTTFGSATNLVYADTPTDVDGDRSWWNQGDGCDETAANITINNYCTWEVADCFGLNLAGDRYLWVYMR